MPNEAVESDRKDVLGFAACKLPVNRLLPPGLDDTALLRVAKHALLEVGNSVFLLHGYLARVLVFINLVGERSHHVLVSRLPR